MDTRLHGKIGKLLFDEIKNNGYIINRRRFIWGCVLPDVLLKYRISGHTIKENFKDINEIMKTVLLNFSENKIDDVSIKLGIMTHYLCDFFTYPHNENFKRNLIIHELYEQIQHIKFSKELEKIWSDLNNETNYYIYNMEDVLNYISNLHSIYINNNSNMERDLLYALICIRVVINSIINLIKVQETKEKDINIMII